MLYYRVLFRHQLPSHEVDLCLSDLGEIGFESFEVEREQFLAYMSASVYQSLGQARKTHLQTVVKRYQSLAFGEWEAMPDINWNKEWESHYEPVSIKSFCHVRAPFHPLCPEVKHNIEIEPKMSFGTAHHPTTALMIELMEHKQWEGKEVVDMGCGTGILAILAAKEGAKYVLAVDYDQRACTNAVENTERNVVPMVEVKQGSKELLFGKKMDAILANINRNILIEHIGTYAQTLRLGGELFLSGFYTADIPFLNTAANSFGLRLKDRVEKDGWAALVYTL